MISGAFINFLLHNHFITENNLKKKSGEAKDSVIFPFFILLHKRAKPMLPPCNHFSYPNLLSTFANHPSHPYTHPATTHSDGKNRALTNVISWLWVQFREWVRFPKFPFFLMTEGTMAAVRTWDGSRPVQYESVRTSDPATRGYPALRSGRRCPGVLRNWHPQSPKWFLWERTSYSIREVFVQL